MPFSQGYQSHKHDQHFREEMQARHSAINKDTSNVVRSELLVDAARQFSLNPSPDREAIEQFKALFYGMARDVAPDQLRLASAILSRCTHLPSQVAYYLALQEFEIAAPLLLMSPVLKSADILKLEPKLSDKKLAVVARRGDIGIEVASQMIARKSKLICRALDLNPVFRINSIVESAQPIALSGTLEEPSQSKTAKARDELIDIAKRARSISARHVEVSEKVTKPLHVELLESVRTKDNEKSRKILSQQCGLADETLSRLINAERPEGIVVLLKGLRYSKAHASQIILRLSPWASRSVSYYNNAMQVYQNTPPSQCTEILAALGIQITPNHIKQQPVQTNGYLGQVANERRQQFDRRKSAALFGAQKMAG